ncbi:c-type cytochrome [Rhodoferax sp. GW822-FHT02A01]|uniref:c-type cytochrome n=1 Tax=Rhodoferax sp. GW822-FHT02A01 TaxID=3141537 RepID=UPI00315DE2E9
MKTKQLLLKSFTVVAAVLTMSACTSLGSSRDVANPGVPGKVVAVQVCSNCHGVTGESTSPAFPKLAGQQKEYLAAQLADFKGHDRSDSRGTQYMWGFTHLTAGQVDELADYFSSQPAMRAHIGQSALLVRGEQIFNNGIPENEVVACMACHGPKAEGNGGFPRLAGQHASYVVEQLKVFKHTDQRPRGAAMKQITHALSDQDMEAVAQYLASIGSPR